MEETDPVTTHQLISKLPNASEKVISITVVSVKVEKIALANFRVVNLPKRRVRAASAREIGCHSSSFFWFSKRKEST